jgi:DNA-binding Xre family transcriptional regulator
MQVSYKKLWKLLIDKDMKKSDLAERANVSVATLTKLTKSENVNVDILVRICSALECEICDIMELVGDNIGEETGKW